MLKYAGFDNSLLVTMLPNKPCMIHLPVYQVKHKSHTAAFIMSIISLMLPNI